MESNVKFITRSYPGEESASATLPTEETSGQEDAAATKPGRPSIPPGTYAEANNGDPEDHLKGMALFSTVLAPNTSITTVEDTDLTRALQQMGVVLTNEVYDGVLIPNRHDGKKELNQSLRLFFK